MCLVSRWPIGRVHVDRTSGCGNSGFYAVKCGLHVGYQVGYVHGVTVFEVNCCRIGERSERRHLAGSQSKAKYVTCCLIAPSVLLDRKDECYVLVAIRVHIERDGNLRALKICAIVAARFPEMTHNAD